MLTILLFYVFYIKIALLDWLTDLPKEMCCDLLEYYNPIEQLYLQTLNTINDN
jgi:hypothetical protein